MPPPINPKLMPWTNPPAADKKDAGRHVIKRRMMLGRVRYYDAVRDDWVMYLESATVYMPKGAAERVMQMLTERGVIKLTVKAYEDEL